jgi:hypothetical protein
MTNDQAPMTKEGETTSFIGHWCLVIGHSYNGNSGRLPLSDPVSTMTQLASKHQAYIVRAREQDHVGTLADRFAGL